MKTREEMSAEIQAGLTALLKPLVGEPWQERRAELLRLTVCTVDASGVVTVTVRVRGDMIQAFIDAGWELK